MIDYLKDPQAIYSRSFECVRAATDLRDVPEALRPVALRLVHACGMPEVVDDLQSRGDVASAVRTALANGAPVLVDCEMLRHGIIRNRLPRDNVILCTLNEPDVRERATALGTTRSAAAVELWPPHLEGAVIAIGNAPTALFRLIEGLAQGWPRPAAIVGFPVGFVGAAESKQALMESCDDIPCVVLRGRRGGSALAAAAINACAASSESNNHANQEAKQEVDADVSAGS
ncbi:MAG: precorrin-8X/cobalt-precorrin-8 methylmutase [Gammaproteobacteria bacterium]|jgi:precorrin-8X/cobalt-precorrin-8 methylmutase